MLTEEKLASPVAALASLVLHALVLAVPLLLSARAVRTPELGRPVLDSWAARSVEVGTVPDIREQEPVTGPAPPPAPAPHERAASAPVPEEPRELASPARLPSPAPATAPRAASSLATTSSAIAPAPAPAETSVPSGASSAAPTSHNEESPGSLGAVGLPPGMRHLATAFTRALPAGGYKDAAWTELPLGPLGRASISMEISENGELGRVEVVPDHGLPPALERMLQRAVLLLRSGTFSLDPRQVRGGGSERLDIEVTIATRPPNPDELAAPGDLFAQSFMAPKPGVPGYARFTLNSGRHIEAVVRYAAPASNGGVP